MRKFTSRITPIDDTYSTCEFTYAELRIYPGELDPAAVSQKLMILPTSSMKKGDQHVNSLGRRRTEKLNGWFLSSEGQVSSKDLRSHLDWLLNQLTPVAIQLSEFQQLPGVSMAINCVWWSAAGHGGPTLWPEQMAIMADLNLECTFDIYFLNDEAEQYPGA